jgi:anaerobic selenocysteine-containing dehydrogenase
MKRNHDVPVAESVKMTRDSIADIWGDRKGYYGQWPERIDELTQDEPQKWVRSACVLCSNGCALDIGVKDNHIVGVRGLGTDAVNHGRLGPKGMHGWMANNSPDRLVRPLIRKNGKLIESSWDEAMNLVVRKAREIKQEFTGNAIGFYTTGQFFIEDYYTLGVVGKAGIGTPHMDGNTRLCTATAAAALKLSFGSDGQPGSYTDLDTTETILHFGHNIAEQQTVLWMRILDRLAGSNPPKLVVVDPRTTYTAEKATVHLAPRVGTNVAVLNGLLNLIISSGNIDRKFIDEHTVGFSQLEKIVSKYTPEKVQEITGIPAFKLKEAANILASTNTLVSTALQGVYQSMQASAAAVQINNIHIIRGLIGKRGCGIYQMNGQPTAQNTRETGADGDLPGFRNWENDQHMADLARIWNIEPSQIPHWAPPTHAAQIFDYAEKGLIKMLWISGTNPAVSMPNLAKIRKILKSKELFVVVQDAFLTETTNYADVVFPAALWGEKTGTFTNVDRTVHISHKAVDPPGEARPDMDIFIDFAKRMDFRDKDGQPLIKWSTPEEAFEAWKECSKGRPCDYSGLTYEKLSRGSGIQWPCNEKHPDGTEHLYTDGVFNTAADYCETYGHDIVTGGEITPEEYRASDPAGKAIIRVAEYLPPHEIPDKDYPLWLTTGRVVYHFHTRTKTARSPELNEAAPDAFVQISSEDAVTYNIKEGDMVHVESPRGEIYAPAVIGNIIPGHVFVPFHYGYWDKADRLRAANELTIYEWDSVSKQPHFKYAAVRIKKAESGFKTLLSGIKDIFSDKK